MPTFSGRILGAHDTIEGWITVEAGRITATGRGEPPEGVTATGWIVPAPVNAHTHVGDAFLHGAPGKPRDVAALVGPGGWKHHHLADAPPEAQAAGVQRWAGGAAGIGTAAFVDFREGGAAGARWLRGLDLPVRAVIHGRPAQAAFSEGEAAALFDLVDGVGLSGMRDMPGRALSGWAEACHDARLPLGLHVSEDRRDDVDAVIALEPAYVVHMTQGTAADFDALAHEGIPVVACPRSNAWFGMASPVATMADNGVTVALGTDNGMLCDGDLLAEAAAAQQAWPEAPVDELLRITCHNGRRIAGLDPLDLPRRGQGADWIVLPTDPLPIGPRRKPSIDLNPAYGGGP